MAIYVIEDHPLMREAITMLLRRLRGGAEIIELGQLSDLDASVASHGAPELICLDLKLPDTMGMSAVRLVATRHPDVPIAVISATPASDVADWCREAGAHTYIEKSASPSEILNALRKALSPPGDAGDPQGAESQPAPQITRLSKRQKQLLVMLDQGLSNRDIAGQLDISEHTVKVHLWRLFRRLGIKSRTQAVHQARLHGLLGQ